jgi:hypothetical protein
MQSLLRKRRNEAAQIQNMPSKAFPEIARTPVVTFVSPKVSYSLPKCLMSLRLYSSEVEEVIRAVVSRRKIAHGPHLEIKLRKRGLWSNVKEFLQLVLWLNWRCWWCCEPL